MCKIAQISFRLTLLFNKHGVMKSEYQIENDVNCLLETLNISEEEFCTKAGLSRRTLHYAYGGKCTIDSLEKAYSAIYNLGIRLNLAKTEIYLVQKLETEFFPRSGSADLLFFRSRQSGSGFTLTSLSMAGSNSMRMSWPRKRSGATSRR